MSPSCIFLFAFPLPLLPCLLVALSALNSGATASLLEINTINRGDLHQFPAFLFFLSHQLSLNSYIFELMGIYHAFILLVFNNACSFLTPVFFFLYSSVFATFSTLRSSCPGCKSTSMSIYISKGCVDTLYQYIIYRSTSYNPFYNQRTEHLVVG